MRCPAAVMAITVARRGEMQLVSVGNPRFLRRSDPALRRSSVLPGLVLNVPAIALKSPAEVGALLGPPEANGDAQLGVNVRNRYKRGTVEVVFVEGKACWIKLYNPRSLSFSKESLPKLGLPAAKPTYVNSTHVMSWSNLANLKEVSMYGGANGFVSSVLICARAVRAA